MIRTLPHGQWCLLSDREFEWALTLHLDFMLPLRLQGFRGAGSGTSRQRRLIRVSCFGLPGDVSYPGTAAGSTGWRRGPGSWGDGPFTVRSECRAREAIRRLEAKIAATLGDPFANEHSISVHRIVH